MIFVVERARKCLDFSATLYIIHLYLCILNGGWPSSMAWWVVNGTGLAVMALLAEYLCIKREQREIPMDRFHSSMILSLLIEISSKFIYTYSFFALNIEIKFKWLSMQGFDGWCIKNKWCMYRDENWAQNKFSPVGPHYLCLQLFLVTLNFLTHVSLLHFQLYGKKQTNTIRLSNECFNVASCVNSLLSSHSFFFILDTCPPIKILLA